MAQIIKHRRGSLEDVSSAVKRAGELLVVTGSSGITATNGDSILFMGVDGSTVTPANKILQGSSVPDLTGASYDTSIDGLPFYDTSAQKLYILNKGGNVEVKATANTGGTGIVSGSSQVIGHLPSGTVSGSSQVNADSITNFDSNVKAKLDDDGVVSGSSQITIGDTTGFSTFSSSIASVDSALDGRISDLETFSSSLEGGFVNNAELAAATGALESTISNLTTDDIAEGTILYYTDVRVKTKLDTEGVVSGSSQVVDILGSLNSYTESNDTNVTELFATASDHETRVDALEEAVGEGSNIDGRLTSLEAFSGSTETSLAAIHTHTASVDSSLTAIHSYTSSLKTGISLDGANVTILGNLEVQGTQTIVDSTTVSIGDNIIELNGSGAANGGLYVKDATAPNTATGSLLWDSTNDYWKAGVKDSEIRILLAEGDGVVSGSGQIDLSGVNGDTDDVTEGSSNLYYTDARVKTKLDADGVISGSEQVTISSTTGYNDFSSSIATAISASVAASDWANLNGKPEGIVSGAAQVVDYLDSENVNLGGISGSSLDITGNAKIDGNLVLGGNITIGDASGDTISFGGEISSDIIPSANNTYDLGSATDKFAEIHATTLFGSISATNGVVSGSSQVVEILSELNSFTSSIDTTIKTKLDADTVVSSSAQIVTLLSNQATDFGTGRVSADDFGNSDGTSTFTGSFVGDGSGLTGLATNLSIEDGKGNSDTVDLLNDTLSIASGSGLGVDVTVSNNTITISGVNASTSVKGVASFGSTNFSVTSGDVSIKSGGVTAANLNADVAGTGIELNGVDNSIEVSYGSTSGTAVEGNTSLTVQGTSNEIEVSGGSVTLGAGGTVTIGLPDSVTIATASIQNNLSVGGNVEITGNLSVLGTTTTIDSTTVQIGDNILELNIGGAQSTAGIQVTDATGGNTVSGSLLWDGTNDYWKGGALGSEKEFARLNTAPTSNTVLKADANGLLVDSLITDDGTNVTISGTAELRINGATANSFVYFDSNKSLEAVTPSNAGDVIQWNGSSFVASNELDGGTF